MTPVMKLFAFVSLAIAAVEAAAIHPAPASGSTVHPQLNDSMQTFPPPGFTLVDTQWEVEIRQGEKVQLKGTVESVYAQMLQLNPDFEKEMAERTAARGAEQQRQEGQTNNTTTLGKRDHSECNGGYRPALRDSISKGIEYLAKVNGEPAIDGGTCSRVSCSDGGGIGWCSDRSDRYTVNSFGWIGNAAEVVVQSCSFPDMYGKDWVAGRRYHDANVSVWVGAQQC
ncbi:hypothetical protein MCOR25_003384 [Pyricularia grisea]|uniref:Secreted protein n=1 Tax=Pyricularia grisea TaxID=148305 RepID=A0A6P8BE00_PYRGI|nr:uncharacterized protein PgNI_03125 [Pyricularia grisea]KAI6373756.1 hypothetical protein MCOR25_003384 [Pyricularia grisea]TLD13974.1 hypothetical protein PgNI_03125 [Pyricularia grisea]